MSAVPDPVTYPMEEHRKPPWRLNIKLIIYNLVVMPVVGVVVWNVNAKGIQTLPGLSLKLSRAFPGFASMSRYEYWRDLTIAHPMAILMLFFVWMSTLFLVRTMFFGFRPRQLMNAERSLRIITCVSVVFVLADVWLFYRGVSEQGFFGSNGTFTGFLATVVYAGIIWLAAVFHVVLKEDLF